MFCYLRSVHAPINSLSYFQTTWNCWLKWDFNLDRRSIRSIHWPPSSEATWQWTWHLSLQKYSDLLGKLGTPSFLTPGTAHLKTLVSILIHFNAFLKKSLQPKGPMTLDGYDSSKFTVFGAYTQRYCFFPLT